MGNAGSSESHEEPQSAEQKLSQFGKRMSKLGKRTHVGFASTRSRSGAYKAPVKVYKTSKGGAKLYVLKKGKLEKLRKNRMMVRKTTAAARASLNAKRVAKNKALKKKVSKKKVSKRLPSKSKLRSRGRVYNQCTQQKRRAACKGQMMPDGSARCKWRKPGSKPRCVLAKGNAPPAPPKMPGMAPWLASADRAPTGVSAKSLGRTKLAKGVPAPPPLPGTTGTVRDPTDEEKRNDTFRRILAANARAAAGGNPWAGRFGGYHRPSGFGIYPRRL